MALSLYQQRLNAQVSSGASRGTVHAEPQPALAARGSGSGLKPGFGLLKGFLTKLSHG
jgi:hypothetical protein